MLSGSLIGVCLVDELEDGLQGGRIRQLPLQEVERGAGCAVEAERGRAGGQGDVVDDTEELGQALRFACRRAVRTGGRVALLYVIKPAEFQHWASVGDLMREERRAEAEEMLQVVASVVQKRTGTMPALYIREGKIREELIKLIDEETAISVLVLGAATGEGRHTTTHTELIALEGGGLVGDIPGVKELRFWGIESHELPDLYIEFRPYLGQCRFRDCTHIHEPGCALKEAVSAEKIPLPRYESYLRISQGRR